MDLTDVDQVDSAGRYLVALLKERGAGLNGSGLVITDLMAAIVEGWQLDDQLL